MNESETEHEYGTEAGSTGVDPVLELRLIFYGLGLLVLLMSLSLNLFIRKQNNNIQSQIDAMKKQIVQIEESPLYKQNKSAMGNLLDELKSQVREHPETAELLQRYGIAVSAPPPPLPKQ